MRYRWLVSAVLACGGCGDQDLGVPRDVMVEDLEQNDAVALCDEFVALICGDYRGDDYCNECILYDLCLMPELFGTMDNQCRGVTVGEVRDCAHVRDEEVCSTAAGGCLFDVAVALCK